MKHILVNGLSVGSGGGYTVAVELWRELARARPDWRITLALTAGNKLHEEARKEAVPENCALLWAPPETAAIRPRTRYESRELVQFARTSSVAAVIQLNGMLIDDMPVPTLAHCQDPWPMRPEAWNSFMDRIKAWAKRRRLRHSLRHSAAVGWTSAYLRDLMCDRLHVRPARGAVLYNGLPADLLKRTDAAPDDLRARPLRIVTISNVGRYKRQYLVIQALPALIRTPGLEQLQYHIAGHIEPTYREELTRLATDLGVADHVHIEGRVSRERIEELFSRSRCYVLMSVCESFGLPAIEAMSYATPVVTADCCAMPEVCGSAADLVPPDDLERLQKTLASVLLDDAHAESLRENGRRRVQSFRWSDTAAQMAELVEQIS